MAQRGRPPLPFHTGYSVNERGCWLWQRGKHSSGYATYRHRPAHRYSFELVNGPIPPGMEACHSCDVKHCVNPAHLFLGSHKENMGDAAAKKLFANQRKTHCPQGHEYTEENTLRYGVQQGRRCRICENRRQKKVLARKRSERRARGLRHNGNKAGCKRGHAFTPENTYVWRGSRHCRACNAAHSVRAKAGRRAARNNPIIGDDA